MSPRTPTRRFDPPPLRLDAETRWLLVRAFGPLEAAAGEPHPKTARLAAQRSGLACRIASRAPAARIDAELGAEAAGFVEARRQATRHFLAYQALLDPISELARARRRPVVLLKGFALVAAGFVAPGGRDLGDLDILVDRSALADFATGLEAAGFTPTPGSRNDQHIPPMRAPGWGVVDVHDALRGVGDAAADWLDASGVLAVGEPAEIRPGCWVPDRRILAAHALAHGLEQHATSPAAYPLLRAPADLIDLLNDEEGWRRALPLLRRLLRRTLREGEILAARDLCLSLQRGGVPEASESPAGRLLAHLVAHTFDPDYRTGLRGGHRRYRLLHALRHRTLVRYALRKLKDRWRGLP